MSDAERKLLIWCGIMLVRGAPLTPAEANEIDHLIADVRSPLPKIEWDSPVSGRVAEREAAWVDAQLAAVAAERERCATIARARSNYSGLHPFRDIAYLIAADIERGD
jgi:hypothetical protein